MLKKKGIEYVYYMPHETRSGKIKANKSQQISVTTHVFSKKTKLQHI